MSRISNRLLIVPVCGWMVVWSCLTTTGMSQVEDSAGTNQATFNTAWRDLQAVVECVMQEHLSPPTRQQLYLSACRGFYLPSQTRPPGDLSESFSKLTTNEQFQEILSDIWDRQIATGIAPQQLSQFAVASAIASAVRPASTVAEDELSGPTPRFVTEKENRVRKQLAENQYVGIGIKVGLKDGYPQILEPFYGGAAQLAGAREGDLIVAVNGAPSMGREFRDIIEDLRGEKGSILKVTLRHDSEKEDREYTMIRNVIPIATVTGHKRNEDGSWALELPGHSDIAYLKITDIVGSTAAELMAFARKIQKQNFRGVILDFTANSGNSVPDIHHAIMLADALLGEAIIGDLDTKDNTTEIRTQADHVFANMPIVIFSPRIVSGPEFLVLAAMANHGRAKIVGPMLSSRGLCTKSIDLEGLGAIDQLPYALAIPRGQESSSAPTTTHDENTIQQFNEKMTLTPHAIVQNPEKMENYLQPALELFNR